MPSTQQDAPAATSIKVRSGDDLRRFEAKLGGFPALDRRLRRCYALEADVGLLIKFKDDEGDLCSITNNAELQIALGMIGDTGGLLRLEVFLEDLPVARVTEPVVEVEVEAAAQGEGEACSWRQHGHGKWRNVRRGHGHGGHGHDGHGHGGHGHGRKGFGHRHHGMRRGGEYRKGAPAYQARFVKDISVADGETLTPGTSVTKTWLIANAGKEAWPEGTTLLRVGGDLAGPPETIDVPRAAAGSNVEITVPLVTPTAPGRYVSYWRLQDTDGNKFGQRFWCMFHVRATEAQADAAAEPVDGAILLEEAEAMDAVLEAELTAAQAKAVLTAFRERVHHGISCDVTGVAPIRGTRYTRKAGDDTFDVCEEAFGNLDEAERESLRAMPRPEVALLIKHVTAPAPAAATQDLTDEEDDYVEVEQPSAEPEAEEAAATYESSEIPEAPPSHEDAPPSYEDHSVATRLASQFGLCQQAAAGFVEQSDMEEDLISALLEGSLVMELEPSVREFSAQLEAMRTAEAEAAAAAAEAARLQEEATATTAAAAAVAEAARVQEVEALQQMLDMGFTDREAVLAALHAHEFDLARVVAALV